MASQSAKAKTTERLYRILFDEPEEARVCLGIPEAACHEVPGNFFKITAAQTLTKLADELTNAKTVLPWLLGALGASAVWVGFLVPIRESMSMLPQILIADAVRGRATRKSVWAIGGVLQALALAVLAITAYYVSGEVAGAAVLGLVLIISLARGLCSIASKDVMGKTIPKKRRGRLTGLTAAISGTLSIGLGIALVAWKSASEGATLFVIMIAAAAFLWFAATGVYRTIVETPGATEGGRSAFREALQRLTILRTDPAFRRFVIVRALLISTALAGPYYVMIARQSTGGAELIGMFVLASAIASALSSFVWGWFADHSSRLVLVSAAAIASALGALLFIFEFTGFASGNMHWIAPGAFFILAIAHSGVRIARKTYILDLAGGDKRTDYVSVSNTVIGAILLATGLIGALTPLIGPAGMLLLLAIIGFTGAVLGIRLPEA